MRLLGWTVGHTNFFQKLQKQSNLSFGFVLLWRVKSPLRPICPYFIHFIELWMDIQSCVFTLWWHRWHISKINCWWRFIQLDFVFVTWACNLLNFLVWFCKFSTSFAVWVHVQPTVGYGFYQLVRRLILTVVLAYPCCSVIHWYWLSICTWVFYVVFM